MESQDTVTLFLLKVWPALEANRNRIIGGAVAVVLLVMAALFLSWQRDQKEINAGQELSQLIVDTRRDASPAQLAGQFAKVAEQYPGTEAAQRAQLQAATARFVAGDYTEAQAQFKKFAETYPTSSLRPTAELGQASALEAQGKSEAALEAYQKLVGPASPGAVTISAQFALGRIFEQQGKISEAIKNYQQVFRMARDTTLGFKSMLKNAELSANLAAKNALSSAITSALKPTGSKAAASNSAVKVPLTAPALPAAK
jgi:predicted negative regulator of RcsB-dependent stress response